MAYYQLDPTDKELLILSNWRGKICETVKPFKGYLPKLKPVYIRAYQHLHQYAMQLNETK